MKKICLGAAAGLAVAGVAAAIFFTGLTSKKNTSSASVASPRSYFRASIPADQPVYNEPIRLIFGGDLMFDRQIRQAMAARGGDYLLGKLDSLLADADLVIANLEGPVTDSLSVSSGTSSEESDHFRFTFPKETAPLLARHYFRMVSLGNNHILNFGQEGLAQTKQSLEKAGIGYFGFAGRGCCDPIAETVTLKDKTIALVNYNQFAANGLAAAFAGLGRVKETSDLIIVYAHWGEEYQPEPTDRQRQIARQLIDAGVDLVIGSHPHVIQTQEVYQGKRIYYSLGNLVFDQYFSEAVRRGLLVEVVFDPVSGELEFTEHPTYLETDGRTVLNKIGKN